MVLDPSSNASMMLRPSLFAEPMFGKRTPWPPQKEFGHNSYGTTSRHHAMTGSSDLAMLKMPLRHP